MNCAIKTKPRKNTEWNNFFLRPNIPVSVYLVLQEFFGIFLIGICNYAATHLGHLMWSDAVKTEETLDPKKLCEPVRWSMWLAFHACREAFSIKTKTKFETLRLMQTYSSATYFLIRFPSNSGSMNIKRKRISTLRSLDASQPASCLSGKTFLRLSLKGDLEHSKWERWKMAVFSCLPY